MDRASESTSRPSDEPSRTDAERAVRRRAVRRWTAGLVLLCAGVLWLQWTQIERTLPYPQDIDEGYVSGPAHRTVVTGNLHPYSFLYPSLPKCLAAAGMAGGFLRSAGRLEIQQVQRIGSVGYPYYEVPGVVQGARQLFALLSVVALAATGAAAWLAFRRPSAIVLAPLALATSPLFFYHSWTYLNVDIVGTCFVTLAMAAVLRGMREPSMWHSAVLPGLFAGLATGSKYTLAVVVLPVMVAIGFHITPGRRVSAACAAVVAMVLAFLVVMPYSLIDLPGFLDGLAQEAFHYANGHRGAEGPRGGSQLAFYARHLASTFGPSGTVAAVLGVVAFSLADWRRAAVLLSFPIALLASQRVHFERNVLSLHPVTAVFLAYGAVVLHGWVMRGWAWRAQRTPTRTLTRACALLLAVLLVPLWHLRDQVRDRTDSRKVAEAWLEARLPADWTIVVPSQLRVDVRGLTGQGRHVTEVDLQAAQDAGAFERLVGAIQEPAVLMLPRWAADDRFPGQQLAEALNDVSRHMPAVKSFGTHPVLVNYTEPVPWGDPAFALVVVGSGRELPP